MGSEKTKDKQKPSAPPPAPEESQLAGMTLSKEQVEEIKQKLDQLKTKMEQFKKKVVDKFEKYIIGITLLPPRHPADIERETGKKLTEEEIKQLQQDISILVLVDDSDVTKMSRIDLKEKLFKIIDKMGEDIDKNFKPQPMLMTELTESCFDAKYEILQLISLSAIFYDPRDVLGALKLCEVHKGMVLKKFEKYVVSYVAVGSLFRGDARSNDIDVAIVIDDTDVKKMPRLELKDKLGAIIRTMGLDAADITKIKKSFHIQVYILTDFWDSIKEASPVIFTFLRDGVPFYDRGVYMPWKLLLTMGRIKPSPEAIDMHMDVGERLLSRAKGKLLSVLGEDLYYACMNPAQAALMLYGLPPATHRETIKLLDEIFVKKEKMLTSKDVDVVDKTFKFFKGIEHGTITNVTGKEIDQTLEEAGAYLTHIKKVFATIEKRTEKKRVEDFYDNTIKLVKDVLNTEDIIVTEHDVNGIKKGFKKLADTNKIPKYVIKELDDIIQMKQNYQKLRKMEIEKVIREKSVFLRGLMEYIQRKRGLELERAKIRVKYGNTFGEVFLLEETAYIIDNIDAEKKKISKAKVLPNGGLGDLNDSTIVELEEAITSHKIPKHVFIKEKIFEDLRRIFGDDVQVLVSY